MSTTESPKNALDYLQTRFRPERAGNMNAVIQFNITGEGGGTWYIVIKDKMIQVNAGAAPQPNATVTMSAADWASLAQRPGSAESLYDMGRIRIQGDLYLVERLQYLFA